MHSDALALRMCATGDDFDPDRVLATVTYGNAEQAPCFNRLGVVQLPVLSDARVVHAIWAVGGPFQAGSRGPCTRIHGVTCARTARSSRSR